MSAQGALHPDRSTTLVVADAGVRHRFVSERLARQGRDSITVRYPLETIRCLQDESCPIDAVIAPTDRSTTSTADLFAFLRDEYPTVRRITYAT